MAEQRIIVSFGETEIAEGLVSARTYEASDNVVWAEIVVPNEALLGANPDYQAEARLLEVSGSERETMYTGMVNGVTPREKETEIVLVSPLQLLNETRSAGLGVGAGSYALETTWSLLRAWGVEADRLSFPNFRPPLEVFEVATALDGIKVNEPINLGGIRLLPAGTVSRLADGLGPDYLREMYSVASAWALSLQTARTIFDAESEGLKAIDVALAWLTARARYSSVALPEGYPRRFRRAWTLSRVSRRDVIVVRGAATGRRWLRSPRNIPNRPALVLDDLEDLGSVPLPSDLPVPTREALAAWHRAVEETDPLAAVIALSDAAEFYASGTQAPKMFSKSVRKSIRKRAIEGLEGEQLKRVEKMAAKLNEPPLMARLRVALEEDRVPYEEEEFTLLQKLRSVRNASVHGQSRGMPSEADLKYAKAIVNRMLVHRISRLTRPTPGAVEG